MRAQGSYRDRRRARSPPTAQNGPMPVGRLRPHRSRHPHQGPSGRPSRPWLTTVMDDYSWAICGYMVFEGAPSAMNTALAPRQAIWLKGLAWPCAGIPSASC
ncbi:hypothetical protein QJS66_23440 (plasmid) [Kocuria rhizophila]|nr:hypothetical protein QJS66_23440 [Kocuria rhizophila]